MFAKGICVYACECARRRVRGFVDGIGYIDVLWARLEVSNCDACLSRGAWRERKVRQRDCMRWKGQVHASVLKTTGSYLVVWPAYHHDQQFRAAEALTHSSLRKLRDFIKLSYWQLHFVLKFILLPRLITLCNLNSNMIHIFLDSMWLILSEDIIISNVNCEYIRCEITEKKTFITTALDWESSCFSRFLWNQSNPVKVVCTYMSTL